LHEVTKYSREALRSAQMQGLELDAHRIRGGQSNIRMELRDSEWIYDEWKVTFDRLRSLMTRLYSEENATWRLYEMRDMNGNPDDNCAGVQSYEVSTGGCELVFTGQTLNSRIPPLARGSFSSIFSARPIKCPGVPDEVVIKYANNCVRGPKSPAERYEGPDWIKTADESVMEYAVLRMIEDLDIAPRVYSLSAPSVPQGEKAWNYDLRPNSELMPTNWRFCMDQKAIMRALVQDKIFSSVLSHSSQKTKADIEGIRFIIRSGLETVRMLRVLHDNGFIHGDIHSGNVALKDDTGRRFSLIDFGLAKFFPVEIGTPDVLPGPITVAASLLSPWHLRGHRLGRRDDVFRAIEMVAFLLSEGALLKDQPGLAPFKENALYFTGVYTVTTDWKNKVTAQKNICAIYGNPDGCVEAMNHLNRALGVIRETPTTDSRPSYGKILDHFAMALEFLGEKHVIQL
jgi:serine/threonine protein kinase